MIKKVIIECIPHLSQRYNTVGDWQFLRNAEGDLTELHIKVSEEIEDPMLVAVHELIEALAFNPSKFEEEKVDEFDMNWVPRKAYWKSENLILEPGDDYNAPYHKAHMIASAVERLLASQLFIDWSRYEAIIDSLCEKSEAAFAQRFAQSFTIKEEALADQHYEATNRVTSEEAEERMKSVDPEPFDPDDISF